MISGVRKLRFENSLHKDLIPGRLQICNVMLLYSAFQYSPTPYFLSLKRENSAVSSRLNTCLLTLDVHRLHYKAILFSVTYFRQFWVGKGLFQLEMSLLTAIYLFQNLLSSSI